MEGLLLLIGLIAAGILAGRWGAERFRRNSEQPPPQQVDPPGERSAPDDWPRDGGDNPRAP